MYVVLKGKVAIRVGGKLIENVGPGGIFGEMALVDRTPRLASVIAESNVKVLAINRAAFLNLVKHSRRFAASLLSAVSPGAREAASGCGRGPGTEKGGRSRRSPPSLPLSSPATW